MRFRIAAGVFAFLSMTSFISQAATTTEMVQVVNLTKFNNFQEFASKNLGPELKEVLQRRGLAVWGYADTVEVKGNIYCVGVVGATYAAAKDRNSRIPAYTYTHSSHRPATDTAGKNKCSEDSLRFALSEMNDSKLDLVLKGIQQTESSSGARAPSQKADNSVIRLWATDISTAGRRQLVELMDKYRVAEFIDYRYMQVLAFTTSTQSDDGVRICWAIAGLVARTPDNRQPRSPGAYNAAMNSVTGGDESICITDAASTAIEGLFDAPWTEQGIFAKFNLAREDGVPMPDLNAIVRKRETMVAQDRKDEQTNLRATRVVSTQKNTLSCTNECQNGACVRTFSDGRQERWQAPRKFDAFTGDWKWDTSSCGG